MPEVYNVYEAKTHLSELMDRATAGEDIILAKAGVEKVKLVPVTSRKIKRVPGRLKGKIWVAPDAFSPEVDEEIWAEFHAKDIFPAGNKKEKG